MMQDYVHMGTYQRAILQNHTDFKDKIVLDVGCGSGILSFFCCPSRSQENLRSGGQHNGSAC
ncbi:Histone-arginine methyltransferase CARM1 [Lemmus lemmus]